MKKKVIVNIILMWASSHSCSLYSDIYGSDALLSALPFFIAPQSPLIANRVAYFGWIKDGFSLANAATSLIFSSVFPVSGDIDMKGGTLILDRDFCLNAVATLQGLGTVIGNNHVFDVCSNITSFPADTSEFRDTTIVLRGDLTIQSNITFKGTCAIRGSGNQVLSFSHNGKLIVSSDSTLTLCGLSLKNIRDVNISFENDRSTLILDDIVWNQATDITFSQGSMYFKNIVDFVGSYTFFYTSSQTSTIAQNSEWHITNGMTLSIGKVADNSTVQPLAFTDLTSVLKVESGILRVNNHGINFTKGTIAAMRDFQIDLLGTSSMTGLILGNNTPQGDMIFDLYPGSSIRYTGGQVVYAITNSNGFKSSSDTAKITRTNSSVFWLSQNLALSNITLDLAALAILNVSPGKTLTYSNTIVSVAQGAFVLNGTRYNAFTTLLNGNQTIFLMKGSLPLYTLASSTGNAIQGSGNVQGAITLQDSNAALTWGVNGVLQNNITLNGGTFILANDLNCMSGVNILGSGTVRLGSNRLNLGSTDLVWTGSTYWDGVQGHINLDSNITLSHTWTFSGTCVVEGHGQTIDLNTGSIVVERGSTVRFTNVKFKNIQGNNIRCSDNAGSIIFDTVVCEQSNNYTFSVGSMQWKNRAVLRGTNTLFTYQSSQQSIIQPQTSLVLDQGLTFSYDAFSPTLLAFSDATAKLVLNMNARLHSTMQGLQLIKGCVVIQENAAFSSEKWTSEDGSRVIDNGITLGNCVNSLYDCVLLIGGGVALTVIAGSLNYKNLNSGSLTIASNLTSLNMGANTSLNVYQTMSMGNAITVLSDQVTLGRAPGADFNGSVSTQGMAFFPNIPSC